MEKYEDDILVDEGLVSHPELFASHPELNEPVARVTVEPLSLVERAVVGFNRHRERYATLGGFTLAGTGFAAGALAFSHRRH